jgi:hypothetical protein
MPSIGQTWVLASIGAVVEMGVLSTLKRLLMESNESQAICTPLGEERVYNIGLLKIYIRIFLF